MGNSKSPKQSGSPNRAFPNVSESSPKKGGNGSPEPESVTFVLVKVDRQVAKKANPQTPVTTVAANKEIEVHTSDGRIGNVPLSRVQTVKESGLTAGFISNISGGGERIEVTLNG